MFDYESFFGNDKKGILFNSFENDLNPYERNFMDDYNNWEDSLEDIIKKKRMNSMRSSSLCKIMKKTST